jgi:hypothetical protein
MNPMVTVGSLYLLMPGWFDLYGPFVVIAVMIVLVIIVFVRQGRNAVLEEIVANNDLGPAEAFRGTLAVEENRTGYLRLRSSTLRARAWRFYHRWLAGLGPQANFDEVTFDGPRQRLYLARKDKQTTREFLEITAIRMRERAGHRGNSAWYLELIPRDGKTVVIATSAIAERQWMFERSAAVAKAAARIVGVPVQVVVAGNAWTWGWPPKKHVTRDL